MTCLFLAYQGLRRLSYKSRCSLEGLVVVVVVLVRQVIDDAAGERPAVLRQKDSLRVDHETVRDVDLGFLTGSEEAFRPERVQQVAISVDSKRVDERYALAGFATDEAERHVFLRPNGFGGPR